MLFVRGDGVILVSPPMRAGVWTFIMLCGHNSVFTHWILVHFLRQQKKLYIYFLLVEGLKMLLNHNYN
jgi:hypothetical protein